MTNAPTKTNKKKQHILFTMFLKLIKYKNHNHSSSAKINAAATRQAATIAATLDNKKCTFPVKIFKKLKNN